MPIMRCPFCDQEFLADKSSNNRNEGGLFILPIEPFATDSTSGAPGGPGGAPGETEDGAHSDDRVARDSDHQQQQQQHQQQQQQQHSR